MRISAKDWESYIDKLSRINKKAADAMQAFIDKNGMDDMSAVVEYAYALATKYGEASGELACEMYDAVAEAAGEHVSPAEIAPTASYMDTAKAVHGTVLNPHNTVPQTVGRLVKQAGADTTLRNALRDGAKFAWIPHGETCAFCLTLASRGWQNMSRNALRNGHAEHIHANCNCEYAISFDKNPSVEGYDPDYYLSIYKNADGAKPADKIKSIRHMLEERATKAGQSETVTVEKKVAIENKYGKEINFEKTFTDKEKFEDSRKCITSLSREYNTRLETVGTGAEKAGGDVDMSGATMRLSSADPTVAIHEFAHTLANSSAEKYGLTNDSDFWKEIKKIRRAYHKDVDADGDTNRWISSYEHSSKSIDEFMAEAFTHAKAKELGYDLPSKYGNDFKYSRQVLEIINKYFKK